jgi:acetylornithine/succinyldiaminopimelate/putrescine aminotransferase
VSEAPSLGEEALRAAIDAELEPRLLDRETYLVDPMCPALSIKRADRSYVWDAYGREYLDFSCAGGSQVLGHNYHSVRTMAQMHLRDLVHTAEDQSEQVLRYPTEYAKALSATITPPGPSPAPPTGAFKVMFTEGEREAIQQALWIGRQSVGKPGLALVGGHRYGWLSGFDQRTFTYISTTKPVENHEWARIGVLLIDPIAHDYSLRDPEWLQRVCEVAITNGALVVFDETVTGFGRTGQMWAHTGYKIVPDIVVMGNAGGAGLPFGAIAAHPDTFATGPYDPSRGGGNSLVCAMGLAQLGVLDLPLLKHARQAGAVIEKALTGVIEQFGQYVTGQSGVGLLRKITFIDSHHANIAYREAVGRGLLLAPPYENDSLSLTPSLGTSERECQRGVDILAAVLIDWVDRPDGWADEVVDLS